MKTALTATLIVLTAGVSVAAPAADGHSGHGAMQDAAPAVAAMSDGVVKKLDKSGAKVTIAHGPLVNLGMPAMTMAFRVKDPAWLDQLKDGDKIRFMADSVNGALTVVKFDKAK